MIMTTLRCAPLKNYIFFGRFARVIRGKNLDLEKNPRLGAQSLQNFRQRTKPGEGSLQKISSDKGREQKPIGGLNNRQENTSENKNSRKSNDQPINCHFLPPIFGCFQEGSDSKIFNLVKNVLSKNGLYQKWLGQTDDREKAGESSGARGVPSSTGWIPPRPRVGRQRRFGIFLLIFTQPNQGGGKIQFFSSRNTGFTLFLCSPLKQIVDLGEKPGPVRKAGTEG
jgi:hypothetical protein